MSISVSLYNTRSRTLEPFVPRDHDLVRLYSCGPTVYARQHLGNLRTYLFADLLKRTLLFFGYSVRHVINITDVGHLTDDADAGEDKLVRAARAQGERAVAIAQRWTEIFQADLAKLGVLPPDVWCKASEHIAEQIAMIDALERRGFTYRTGDGIYFDTSKDDHYGELGRLTASSEHARVQAGDKRHAADFALWKFSPEAGPRRELEWQSPWGVGFPGWHIECSAMASKYLGAQFDIHSGGLDHVPVHHTNEIAQSENALGVRPWVRYWLHAGFLLTSGEKIAKARGHALSLDDLGERGYSPDVYRYYTLTAHYRKPLEFSWAALDAARIAHARLEELMRNANGGVPAASDFDERFRQALADDLDAPAALAVLWQAARSSKLDHERRAATVQKLGAVLGLSFAAPAHEEAIDRELVALLEGRQAARAQRDFERADALRAELWARGYEVEDQPAGPRLKRRTI